MRKENWEQVGAGLRWEKRRMKQLDNPSRQNQLAGAPPAPLTLQFPPFWGHSDQEDENESRVTKIFRESRSVFLCPFVWKRGGCRDELGVHSLWLPVSQLKRHRQGRSWHYLNPRHLKTSFVLMRWRIAHWGRPNMAAQGWWLMVVFFKQPMHRLAGSMKPRSEQTDIEKICCLMGLTR